MAPTTAAIMRRPSGGSSHPTNARKPVRPTAIADAVSVNPSRPWRPSTPSGPQWLATTGGSCDQDAATSDSPTARTNTGRPTTVVR